MNPELRSVLLGFFIGVSLTLVGALMFVLAHDSKVATQISNGIEAALSDYDVQIKN